MTETNPEMEKALADVLKFVDENTKTSEKKPFWPGVIFSFVLVAVGYLTFESWFAMGQYVLASVVLLLSMAPLLVTEKE